MAKFESFKDVQGWVDANGVEALRRAVEGGRFAGSNKEKAVAWLNAYDRKIKEQKEENERTLLERSVLASELSAQAARSSAKWAMWAVIISVIALVVSAVQYYI